MRSKSITSIGDHKARKWIRQSLLGVFAIMLIGAYSGSAVAQDYGEPGEPIDLTIGYQPYYTQAWQAVVVKYKKYWEKYLPEGSTVTWRIGLQGSIVGNSMLAGKYDIGYMGDMPSILTVTKDRVRDIRMIGTLGLAQDQCSVFMVRRDAPQFSSGEEGVKWWDGKQVAVAKGSCTDRSGRAMMNQYGIEPSSYLNQNIEVQTSNFRALKIDGSIMWEPTASKLVLDGIARRVGDTGLIGTQDGGFLAMAQELIEQRPDVLDGWLKAQLDAELFILDPNNTMEIVDMAYEDTEGFSKQVLWMSFVGKYPEVAEGDSYRDVKYFGFNDDVLAMIESASEFLAHPDVKVIDKAPIREEAVQPQYANKLLEERGLEMPLGRIQAVSPEDYPGREGGIDLSTAKEAGTWFE